MSYLSTVLANVTANPASVYESLVGRGLTDWVPDDLHLKLRYGAVMGQKLDLKDPKTFNEKLQWLKIHDRNPLYTTMANKCAAKAWVADLIGDEYVTPTYGQWSDVADIDLGGLPDQFVLKTNHDSGGVVICRDKETFDLEQAREFLNEHLQQNYYGSWREWPYKDIERKVFAEEYLDPAKSGIRIDPNDPRAREVTDYKFYCFWGEPRYLYVSQGLENHATARISFLNLDWTFAPFNRDDYVPFEELPPKPDCYDEMVQLAKVLSAGIPFVRVDFFVYDGRPRFSEMTFSPCGGCMPFDPIEWDRKLGDELDLTPLQGR